MGVFEDFLLQGSNFFFSFLFFCCFWYNGRGGGLLGGKGGGMVFLVRTYYSVPGPRLAGASCQILLLCPDLDFRVCMRCTWELFCAGEYG